MSVKKSITPDWHIYQLIYYFLAIKYGRAEEHHMCGFNIDGNFWQSLHFGPKCTYMSHRDKNISKMYTHQILSNPKQTNLWRLCPNLRINPQISN